MAISKFGCLVVLIMAVQACGETAPAPPYGGSTAPSPKTTAVAVDPPTADDNIDKKASANDDKAAEPNADHQRLAEVHAAIQCAEAQFKAAGPKQKAVEAALTRVAMTRAELNAVVARFDDDAAFHKLRAAAVADCEGRTPPKGKDGEPVGDGGSVDDAMIERIKSLAIESECLRRSDPSAEVLKSRMIALYKSYEIPLQTYAKEMTRLANDKAFQAEVATGIGECVDKAAAEAAVAKAAADAVAAEEPEASPAVDVPVVELIPPSAKPIDPNEQPATPTRTGSAMDDPKPAPQRTSGTYNGTITGKNRGTLKVRLRNNSVSSATVRINGVRISLKGTFSNNHLVLGGRKGSDYFKLRGKLNRKKGRITGKWDGAIKRKLMRGKFVMRR